MKQNLRKFKEKDKFTSIFQDFNIPLSIINKSSRQKISKAIKDLNVIDQTDIINIFGNST